MDYKKFTVYAAPLKRTFNLRLYFTHDIIFGSTKKELCDEFEKLMKDKFQMSSMGELTFFLGLQVQQKQNGIFISQDKYVHKILKKFNYSDVKSASTPTDLEKPLVQDGDAADVDEHLYRSMIGSLMYLTASRPDIMFAVCACARFQVSPKTSHLLAVKRIFRYLKGKPSLGLWYSKDSPLELVAYTDSDYAGATQDRKVAVTGSRNQKKGAQLLDYGYNFMDTVIYIDNTRLQCLKVDSNAKIDELLPEGSNVDRRLSLGAFVREDPPPILTILTQMGLSESYSSNLTPQAFPHWIVLCWKQSMDIKADGRSSSLFKMVLVLSYPSHVLKNLVASVSRV
ncbi:uncharacterized mitochondrial protein-like protein [Tanacetum coccineum]